MGKLYPLLNFNNKYDMTIYHSKLRNFSTFVMYKGRVRCIRFQDAGSASGYSEYRCSDAELCKAIEQLPAFKNKVFFIHKKETKQEVEQAVETSTATPYPKVTKIQEAIAVLESEFGVNADSVVSKSDALRLAAKHKISFPNLK